MATRGTQKLKGIKRYEIGGQVYSYYRPTGKRLPDLPETDPEFLAAYLAAANETPARKKAPIVQRDSVENIARRYQQSEDFTDLSLNYQDVRRRDINRLLGSNDGAVGKVAFRDIEARHIQANRRSLSMNPANERLKTWRALFTFAIAEGVICEDQSRFEKKRRRKGRKKILGHLPWTLSEIEAFREAYSYGTEERAMFETLYWTGSRIGDARGLGLKDETDDGFIEFIQGKTGEYAYVPIGENLPHFAKHDDYLHFRKAVDAMGPGRVAYTLTQQGTIRSEKSSSNWFSALARKAGVTKTAHGLRKSRMIVNTELGATTAEVAAWSGHESLKEVEHYTRGVNRKNMLKRSVLVTGQFSDDESAS